MPAEHCPGQGNLVRNNGGNGVTIDRRNNRRNTIVSNRVLGHATPHFDLVDENPGCLLSDEYDLPPNRERRR